jgi:hypothetical protein
VSHSSKAACCGAGSYIQTLVEMSVVCGGVWPLPASLTLCLQQQALSSTGQAQHDCRQHTPGCAAVCSTGKTDPQQPCHECERAPATRTVNTACDCWLLWLLLQLVLAPLAPATPTEWMLALSGATQALLAAAHSAGLAGLTTASMQSAHTRRSGSTPGTMPSWA